MATRYAVRMSGKGRLSWNVWHRAKQIIVANAGTLRDAKEIARRLEWDAEVNERVRAKAAATGKESK